MKRGLTTMLAAAAFFAGHVTASVCKASMSVPSPREHAPEHSCCGKHAPAPAEAPIPTPCCCVDGTNLAVEDESSPQTGPATPLIVDLVVHPPVELKSAISAGGRAPPGHPPDVPLFTLNASLQI